VGERKGARTAIVLHLRGKGKGRGGGGVRPIRLPMGTARWACARAAGGRVPCGVY
jgi:hypothetical protein